VYNQYALCLQVIDSNRLNHMHDSKIYPKPPPSHGALPPEARSKTPLPEAHPRLPSLVAARPLPHPPPLVVARPRPRPLPPRGGRWEGGGQVRRVEWTGLHRWWWRGGAHACHQLSPLCASRPSRHVSVINDNHLVSLMNFNAIKVNWDPYIKIHQQSEFKWSISED
jgi:hypothetical protein